MRGGAFCKNKKMSDNTSDNELDIYVEKRLKVFEEVLQNQRDQIKILKDIINKQQREINKLKEHVHNNPNSGQSIDSGNNNNGNNSQSKLFLGNIDNNEWRGILHPNLHYNNNNNNSNNNDDNDDDKDNKKDQYVLKQKNDGKYVVLNKQSGKGYIGLAVDDDPKVVVTGDGKVGVNNKNPESSLHVIGNIQCNDNFVSTSSEQLHIIKGAFNCRTGDPSNGTGYQLEILGNGLYEIKFFKKFNSRPNVIAIQHIPEENPFLIPLGFVDNSKFGFYEVSQQPSSWIEFFVFGSFS
eukprot:TRINITY_DN194_c1_g1_i1.p1 TRINITY_DN194_c1_g1~~TRINITY_DN194_c1_g1_i1.p1  ORF type:complete len:295 (-),score=93.91 TRINITY_DN194_c1_g1_i1:456-1340(-)